MNQQSGRQFGGETRNRTWAFSPCGITARCVGGGGRGTKNFLRSTRRLQSFLKFPKCFKIQVLSVVVVHHHIQSPTLLGWAFSHLGLPQSVRGFRRFCVCHGHRQASHETLAYPPGLTLFCSLFSKNIRELRQPSTRRNPFVTGACH